MTDERTDGRRGARAELAAGPSAMIPGLIAAILLVVAVFPLEYGYYTFLRIVVTAMAVWLAVLAGRAASTGWMVFAIIAAVVFNPFIPVWASRTFWLPVDLIAAVLFIVAGLTIRRRR